MTRGIASVLLLLYFLTIGLVSKPATWSDASKKVKESVVHLLADEVTVINPVNGEITKGQPSCTGFVIDRLRGLIATAAHCLPFKGLVADGKPIEVVYSDPELDVAILESVAGRRKPELRERVFGSPDYLTEVAGMGFGYNMGKVIVRLGRISEPGAAWGDEGFWITTDFPFVKGMSGGPLFDIEGRVVGIITESDFQSGWVRPVNLVYQKIGPLPFPYSP